MNPRQFSLVLGTTLLSTLVACGVPTQSEPRTVDPTLVPNQLLSGSNPTPDQVATPPAGRRTRAYFVEENLLVSVHRTADGQTPRDRVRGALDLLTSGPSQAEQAAGLSTSIPAELRLSVTAINGRQATIDLVGELGNSPADELTLAVAQIVLTATAVDGIDTVRLTQKGNQIEAPLVDGSLTTEPLSAADYRSILAPQPTETSTE